MRAPKFAINDLVRSRVNPSEGWTISAFVQRLGDDGREWTQFLCSDANGVETIRNGGDLESGDRLKDAVTSDD